MDANGRPPDPTARPAAVPAAPTDPRAWWPRALRFLGLVALLPVLAIAVVFPALRGQPFASADEIDPADLQWLSVRVFNRAELDGGEDVSFQAARPDFAGLLAPLRGATAVDGFPGAIGPWLGEYRMRTRTGRPARVQMYWHRDPFGPPNTPPTVRFKLGTNLFQGGSAAAVVAAVEAAKPNAK